MSANVAGYSLAAVGGVALFSLGYAWLSQRNEDAAVAPSSSSSAPSGPSSHAGAPSTEAALGSTVWAQQQQQQRGRAAGGAGGVEGGKQVSAGAGDAGPGQQQNK